MRLAKLGEGAVGAPYVTRLARFPRVNLRFPNINLDSDSFPYSLPIYLHPNVARLIQPQFCELYHSRDYASGNAQSSESPFHILFGALGLRGVASQVSVERARV